MDDEDLLNLLYRRVYEYTPRRMGRLYTADGPQAIRRDPLAGLSVNPLVLAMPQAPDVIAEAVEDPIAGRRPRWQPGGSG